MSEYLGQKVVSQDKSPFKNYKPFDWAMYFIESYGGIDGSRHKDWVMDQVARIYKGTPVIIKLSCWANNHSEWRVSLDEPTQEYHEWVREMKDGEDGPDSYSYEEGIAP